MSARLVFENRASQAVPGSRRGKRGYKEGVTAWDDDDWQGEPPEGRHTRDRADPDFWRRNRPPITVGAAGISIALIILLIAWLS
jgi:hypothetical protein